MPTLQTSDNIKCSIWSFFTFTSVCLLGTSIVLANSVTPDLQKTMMYCGIAGSGLFVLSMVACCINPMNRILFKNNEMNIQRQQILNDNSRTVEETVVVVADQV
jgi:hypothetical protein